MPSPRPFRLTWTILFPARCARALPVAPATITRAPSALSAEVTLSGPAVSGTTHYNVKHGSSLGMKSGESIITFVNTSPSPFKLVPIETVASPPTEEATEFKHIVPPCSVAIPKLQPASR